MYLRFLSKMVAWHYFVTLLAYENSLSSPLGLLELEASIPIQHFGS